MMRRVREKKAVTWKELQDDLKAGTAVTQRTTSTAISVPKPHEFLRRRNKNRAFWFIFINEELMNKEAVNGISICAMCSVSVYSVGE